MIAREDKSMEAAVVTLRELSAEDEIRLQCEARDRYERDKASYIGMGRDEGIIEGRLEESANTERERIRAEKEQARAKKERIRAEEAEAEIIHLKKLLKKSLHPIS